MALAYQAGVSSVIMAKAHTEKKNCPRLRCMGGNVHVYIPVHVLTEVSEVLCSWMCALGGSQDKRARQCSHRTNCPKKVGHCTEHTDSRFVLEKQGKEGRGANLYVTGSSWHSREASCNTILSGHLICLGWGIHVYVYVSPQPLSLKTVCLIQIDRSRGTSPGAQSGQIIKKHLNCQTHTCMFPNISTT